MTDAHQIAIPGDDGSALMSVALVDALDGRRPVVASLRGAIMEYVRARKKRSAPPEEVIVELKALISVSRSNRTSPISGGGPRPVCDYTGDGRSIWLKRTRRRRSSSHSASLSAAIPERGVTTGAC